VLYTGNGSTQSITNVGFQPDWVWTKQRNTARGHFLVDAVRGVTKYLSSHSSDEELDSGSVGLTAFNNNGVSLGSSNLVNESSGTYVAWNWKANGSGSSNTNGSINTTATSANVDAGFSISTYTGNSTSGATVGHGLSKAPEFIIIKKRSASALWAVYNKSDGNTKVSHLDLNAASYTSAGIWNNTTPDASVFTLGNNALINGTSTTYVAYCFHSVDGYSKVGSYTGNGNADGTFVYTGFRPAFVIRKQTSNTGLWIIQDNARDSYNAATKVLSAESSTAEESPYHLVDMCSNGFKVRSTQDDTNGNGETFIYIAFAETPFKYSNAR
jgi:hypothetical protein